ncbi:hypothetical protein JMJ77_0002598, partial [Colletotrichum scovillei]
GIPRRNITITIDIASQPPLRSSVTVPYRNPSGQGNAPPPSSIQR